MILLMETFIALFYRIKKNFEVVDHLLHSKECSVERAVGNRERFSCFFF